VVVTGRYWLNMMDDSSRRLLDDPFDYLYTELNTALADDEKWVTLLLVDGTTAPEADELPEALRGLLRRDRISVANDAELDAALDSLIGRIPLAGSGIPEEETEPARVTHIQTDAPPPQQHVSEKRYRPGFPSPAEDKGPNMVTTIVLMMVLFVPVLCIALSQMYSDMSRDSRDRARQAVIATNNEIREMREANALETSWAVKQTQERSFATNQAFITGLTATKAASFYVPKTQTAAAHWTETMAAQPDTPFPEPPTLEVINARNLRLLRNFGTLPVEQTIVELAYSSDGSMVALATNEPSRILLYSRLGDLFVSTLETPGRLDMAFRPNSTEIAWSDTLGRVHIYNYLHQKEIASIQRGYQIQFDGSDYLALGGAGIPYQIREIPTSNYAAIHSERADLAVMDVAINGGTAAWALTNQTIQLEFAYGSTRGTGVIENIPGGIYDMKLSPDGLYLAVLSGEHNLQIYGIQAKPRRVLNTAGHEVQSLAISPGSDLLAAAALNGSILFFNLETGVYLQSVDAHREAVTALAFSPDGGQLLSAGMDTTVQVWQVLP
jgi:hypothetical protein